MRKYLKGEIAKIILKSLVVVGTVAVVVALPGVAQVFMLFNPKNGKENYRIRQSLYSLEKKKLVRIYKKDGKEVIEITNKGRKKVLQYDLEDMAIKKPKSWDGMWRVVMFDIPETKRGARNAISRKLKELGFHPLQKSVFVFPYDCRDEIDFIGEYFRARKYIQYMEVENIDEELRLKKKFSII